MGKIDRERLIGFCSQPEEVLWSVEFIGKWRAIPVALEINRKPPNWLQCLFVLSKQKVVEVGKQNDNKAAECTFILGSVELQLPV